LALPTIKLPRYVLAKRGKGGAVYYWNLPTWARKRDAEERAKDGKPCSVSNERLPSEPAKMFARAKELNEALDTWRRGDEQESIRKGSISWLIRWFQQHPKYLELEPATIRSYDQGLELLEAHELDNGMGRVGNILARSLEPYHADRIYERLKIGGKKGSRIAMANAAMRAARRMFNLAIRAKLVDINPFVKMGLSATGGNTRAVERWEVESFIAKADELGMPSVGTAAALAFELCQREGDIITGLTWSRYRHGTEIQIKQHKTGALVWAPLCDEEGELYPGLVARLEATPRHGPLIIMCDRPQKQKIGGAVAYEPYDENLFRKHVRKVRRAAGLPEDFTIMACRHGGLTELGDAEATDQEMMSMSGHKVRQTLSIYSRNTRMQALNAARKRRSLRTKSGQKSENG
jgi:hypothetical protein